MRNIARALGFVSALRLILLVCACTINISLSAQTYDREYVKNLKYRLLISYVSETRDLMTYMRPSAAIDPDRREEVLLKNSPSILSGFMFQNNNSSIQWVTTLPQTEEDIKRYGEQSATFTQISLQPGDFFLDLHHVRNKGFYDQNYLAHPEFEGDTVLYRRHDHAHLDWVYGEIFYFRGARRFCIGLPSYFGERQLKSRATLGARLGFSRMRLSNDDRSFFRDALSEAHAGLAASSYFTDHISLSATPAVYLVARKKLFLYAELSLGWALGRTRTNQDDSYTPLLQLELPQAKLVSGWNSDRLVAAVYWTYLNQTFQTPDVLVGSILSRYGLIIGYRINPLRYARLSWETI